MSQSADLSKIGLEWGYEGTYANWADKYPHAGGSHQSPIDIKTEESVYNEDLTKNPLKFSYDKNCFTSVLNTGSSFKVSGNTEAKSSVIGGPVSEQHSFLQFHMHWGKDESVGSEHLIDGKSYAGELHFVNWNSTRYSQASESVQSNSHDGLIVLGVMVQVGKHNPEFEKITNAISNISLRDQNTQLEELDVSLLFPADTSAYWSYQGSLTTPPCTECVQWVVFRDPIEISQEQLQKLHSLYQCKESGDCCDSYRISQNFRPVCELNSRKVSRTFSEC